MEPNGNVETAYREELRDGDHAEYTLLERKKHAGKLHDAVLFVTLEPCAPGARHPPKLNCAERIVLARIKEVWVGIEDPDPTVDRRGIRFLQDNSVVVRMFDLDLQREIREANKPFLEQASERAEAEEEAAREPPFAFGPGRRAAVRSHGRTLNRYRDTAGIAARQLPQPSFVACATSALSKKTPMVEQPRRALDCCCSAKTRGRFCPRLECSPPSTLRVGARQCGTSMVSGVRARGGPAMAAVPAAQSHRPLRSQTSGSQSEALRGGSGGVGQRDHPP